MKIIIFVLIVSISFLYAKENIKFISPEETLNYYIRAYIDGNSKQANHAYYKKTNHNIKSKINIDFYKILKKDYLNNEYKTVNKINNNLNIALDILICYTNSNCDNCYYTFKKINNSWKIIDHSCYGYY
jgi:hypothetical protein